MNLVAILKDVPKGTKLWSVLHGEVKLLEVTLGDVKYPIRCESCGFVVENIALTKDGKFFSKFNGECILFPSKNCRDWGAFQPTKFDPNTLKSFDQVLVRLENDGEWVATVFSHICNEKGRDGCPIYMAGCAYWTFCIPYNEETKHLVGTKNDPPLFYRV